MISFDIDLSDAEKNALFRLWDEIGQLEKCRKVKYSIHNFIWKSIASKGFQAFLIVGRRGRGKTTYSLKTVANYFMVYEDLECGEAYQETLSRLAFTSKDLMNKIEQYGDIIIWDDAGVWGSTLMWYDPSMRPYLEALLDWFDVARTDINVLMMSAPNKKKLPPKIRDDEDTILIKINHNGIKEINGEKVNTSVAIAVENQESLWNEKTYRPTIFTDYFTVRLPDPVYYFYVIIRRKYSEYTRKRLRKIIDVIDEVEDPRIMLLKKRLGIE